MHSSVKITTLTLCLYMIRYLQVAADQEL